jgi:hypothetical protein
MTHGALEALSLGVISKKEFLYAFRDMHSSPLTPIGFEVAALSLFSLPKNSFVYVLEEVR